MMNKIQLKQGLHFWYQEQEYVIKEHLESQVWQVVELKTGGISPFEEMEFIELVFQGKIVFNPPEHQIRKKDNFSSNFADFPEEIRESAKRKYQYIKQVIESNINSKTKASLQPIIREVAQLINDSKPPTWLTLYRWLKSYEQSGQDLRSLIPKHKSKGDYRPKLNQQVKLILERTIKQIYLTPIQANIADVIEEVIRQINQENHQRQIIGQDLLKIPHRSTIYRAVAKLDLLEVLRGRYGKRMGNYLYEQVQKSPPVSRPLERVEIDHTKLPLFVVDSERRMPIGTPWLTTALDRYSGVILGFYLSFDPPSYLSVMQCLKQMIEPKKIRHFQEIQTVNNWNVYGLPEVIVVDNGKEFYSSHFEDACLSLGIVIQYSPPKMPWYKGAIERYFGALNSQLLSEQPGKTFTDFMKLSNYDSQKNAVISFSALEEMIYLFIVDIYNQSSHPEFLAPRSEIWTQGIANFPPAIPLNKEELSVLIGQITWRKITRRGIEFEGLIYNSMDLARLRSNGQDSHTTKIKYNPTDLSVIYVFDETEQRFLEVPALNQDYTRNLTIWQHKVIKKLAHQEAEKVDIVALILAKEKIQKLVSKEWKITKKSQTRQVMARWLGLGREELNYSEVAQDDSAEKSEQNSLIFTEINSSESLPLSDLSEIGNAFKSTENDDNNSQSEVIANNSLKSSKSKSQKKEKQATKISQDFESNKSEKFEPNLLGWEVSYGLPK
jgi:putative transposase